MVWETDWKPILQNVFINLPTMYFQITYWKGNLQTLSSSGNKIVEFIQKPLRIKTRVSDNLWKINFDQSLYKLVNDVSLGKSDWKSKLKYITFKLLKNVKVTKAYKCSNHFQESPGFRNMTRNTQYPYFTQQIKSFLFHWISLFFKFLSFLKQKCNS